MGHIHELIETLDLSYKIKYEIELEKGSKDEDLINTDYGYINTMEYLPRNMNDYQYLYRTILFLGKYISFCLIKYS